MKNDCLFCGIIHDEIPSYKIYEDELFLVILDRFPKCLGHMLIMPKKHALGLFDLPEETASALIPLAQKLAAKMHEVLRFKGLNLLQNNGDAAGQQVKHFHLHLIPRYDSDDMAIQWRAQDPPEAEFEEMAGKLKI
jgi:histidine triad (HIT) family protein